MHSAEDIEVQLWEYIDGVCDSTARERISQLIATDDAWKQQYTVLMAFHSEMERIEPGHPSMRFTRNVMEQIAKNSLATPASTYINKWVVWSIASVMALLLGSAITYALMRVDWPEKVPNGLFSQSRFSSGDYITYIIMAHALVCVLIADTLLRRKRKRVLEN